MLRALILIVVFANTCFANKEIEISVEKVKILYKGDSVNARVLSVSSIIPINLDTAWNNIQSPALLQFVAKGMIKFKSVDNPFPEKWKQGETYKAKMRVYGFFPFGGTHYLTIDTIDSKNFYISTKEWDSGAKVWNHEVFMKDLGDGTILYEDRIVIYGGFMTGFITWFAKRFYKHRQGRWQIVANEKILF